MLSEDYISESGKVGDIPEQENRNSKTTSSKKLVRRSTIYIPLNKIRPNNFNPNQMDDEIYHALLEDMKESGDYDPIEVRPIEGDFYEIVDGENRWGVAKQLGWNEIACEIKHMDRDKARNRCFRKNNERGTFNPIKLAKFFKEDRDAGLSQEKIAKKYGVSKKKVSKYLSFLKLPQNSQELLVTSRITPEHAYVVASLPTRQQEQILHDAATQTWTVDRTKFEVKKTKTETKISELKKNSNRLTRLATRLFEDIDFEPWRTRLFEAIGEKPEFTLIRLRKLESKINKELDELTRFKTNLQQLITSVQKQTDRKGVQPLEKFDIKKQAKGSEPVQSQAASDFFRKLDEHIYLILSSAGGEIGVLGFYSETDKLGYHRKQIENRLRILEDEDKVQSTEQTVKMRNWSQ